jgi:cell division protease FtsH
METVTKLLKDHKDILTLMAEELLEKETIVLSDIEQMVEELRPGLYTSRMRSAKKAKRKVPPKPEVVVEESVEESLDKEQVEEHSETVVDEHPKDDTESKVTDDDDVVADSDDIQDQQTQKP